MIPTDRFPYVRKTIITAEGVLNKLLPLNYEFNRLAINKKYSL
jgi:hypothetical protein